MWIGANSIILRNSIVGYNSVIAAGAIVKTNVHKNTLLLCEKNIYKEIGEYDEKDSNDSAQLSTNTCS